MSEQFRDLQPSDESSVIELCKDIWEGNDYVPNRFSSWIKEDNSSPIGLFVDGELVALGNLEAAPDSPIAWIKGIRVNTSHQHEGHGTKLVEHMINLARKRGIKKLRYATGSRNEPSVHLAKNLGFSVANSIGYFRLSNPYPQHPAPSPVTVPLVVNSERLHEVLSSTPNLVESGTLPLLWEFEDKELEGLVRLEKRTEFNLIVSDEGNAKGLFYEASVERNGSKTSTYSVFATDRGVFIDIMARILNELDNSGVDRAVFFLGPRATEWAPSLLIVPDDYLDRRYLLLELSLES
ncbi:MAG: GNAT family N-acetyltransferase [Candidatus Thorarchaeota archaeon]